jgi:tetratricopeptide (TPR) repeat protein
VRKESLIPLLLAIVTFGVYFQTRDFDFVQYDDFLYVVNNQLISEGFSPDAVVESFKTIQVSNWHPVTWLSHMLDVEVFGVDPGPHHLVNVVLHVLNTVLLFALLFSITRQIWPTTIVAALFALHPMHVESVAWISERKDLLCAFFWLLATAAYVRYTEKPGAARYFLVFLLFAFSLMSKPMAVTFPFTLLLLDIWPLRRTGLMSPSGEGGALKWPEVRRLVREKIPLFLLVPVSGIATIYAQSQGGAVSSLEGLPVLLRLENSIVAYGMYCLKLIVPDNLSVIYPYVEEVAGWKVGVCGLLLVGISVLSVRIVRTAPSLLVGWFWFLGTLVPVIGLIQVGNQAIADRYTYIPSIGFFIAVVWTPITVISWRQDLARIAVAGFASVIALFTVLTWKQIGTWRNSVTLFGHAVTNTQNNHIALTHLGMTYLRSDPEDTRIIPSFQEALRIKPGYMDANDGMGAALLKQDRAEESLGYLMKASEIDPGSLVSVDNLSVALASIDDLSTVEPFYQELLPDYPQHVALHEGWGVILAKNGRYADGIPHLRAAVALDPSSETSARNLAVALNDSGQAKMLAGDEESAVQEFTEAIQIDPGYWKPYAELAQHYLRNQNHKEVVRYYTNMLDLEIDPGFPLFVHLGNALNLSGEYGKAAEFFEKAVSQNPASPPTYNNWAFALVNMGRLDEAVQRINQALEIDPDYIDGILNLGKIRAQQGDYSAAGTHFRRILEIQPGHPAATRLLELTLLKAQTDG